MGAIHRGGNLLADPIAFSTLGGCAIIPTHAISNWFRTPTTSKATTTALPEPSWRQLLRYGFGVLWLVDGVLQHRLHGRHVDVADGDVRHAVVEESVLPGDDVGARDRVRVVVPEVNDQAIEDLKILANTVVAILGRRQQDRSSSRSYFFHETACSDVRLR